MKLNNFNVNWIENKGWDRETNNWYNDVKKIVNPNYYGLIVDYIVIIKWRIVWINILWDEEKKIAWEVKY